MKPSYLIPLTFACAAAQAQQTDTIACKTVLYFKEAATAGAKHTAVWGRDLYGPLMLVNPETRCIYTNYPDSAGTLKKEGGIYTGQLPAKINIANTALRWQGTAWAMVMLPLPEDKGDRVNLIMHELFHKAQPELGFSQADPVNNHLDKKVGRIWLRMELAALLKAVHAGSVAERKKYITDAFSFRKYRYQCYPGADTTENALELHEGMAEYTGMIMSGRSKEEMIRHFDHNINWFVGIPSFVRSFIYQTTPVYGYLLSQQQPQWNRQVKSNTQLTDYFIKAFGIRLPADLKTAVTAAGSQYRIGEAEQEEGVREEKIKQLQAAYVEEFIRQPHTELRLVKMSISFNPGNIMPLEGYGTVYPSMRVSDAWGILTVSRAALMSNGWDKVTIGLPDNVAAGKATGKGWELVLNEGYELQKDDTGNYRIRKK
ncbi:MAG TPA: hypothetical protein VM802_26010 [Chitinophaga sp.]|uniref:hypothetical protein n=1 Tax=Chitinophaga sp. TaxID=1869181 RepID=UPI002BE71EBE|nr:hypothetical protein [Chitinophaga sp.]HVI48351.1 hypothetical protein [Chitinophaga sp.]